MLLVNNLNFPQSYLKNLASFSVILTVLFVFEYAFPVVASRRQSPQRYALSEIRPGDSHIGILSYSNGGHASLYRPLILPQHIAWLMCAIGHIPSLPWNAQAGRALAHVPSPGGFPCSTFECSCSHTLGIGTDCIWRLFSYQTVANSNYFFDGVAHKFTGIQAYGLAG